jgi:hypothetical protein
MFIKKFKKLLRDPEQFFIDAKINKEKRANASKVTVPAGRKPAAPKPAGRKPAAPKPKKVEDVFRFATDYAAVQKIFKASVFDYWLYYEKYNSNIVDDELVLLPTGHALLDRMVADFIQGALGKRVSFVPVWKNMGNLSLADMEYRLRKGDFAVFSHLDKLADAVVLDGKTLVICETASSIVDFFSVKMTSFSKDYYSIALSRVVAAETEAEPDVGSVDVVTAESAQSLRHYHRAGSPGSGHVLFVGENIDYSVPDMTFIERVDSLLGYVLEQIGGMDDLVLVLPPRKNGFISADGLARINAKYNKHIVFGHEVARIDSVFAKDCNVYALSGRDELVVRSVLDAECSERPFELIMHPGKPLLERIQNAEVGVFAVPDPVTNVKITNGRQKHLCEMLGGKGRVSGAGQLGEVLCADFFVQWGAEPNENKHRPDIYRSMLCRPKLYLEDGFVRSIALWTDVSEPTYSVVMDDLGIYYDATKPTTLENILNSSVVFTDEELRVASELVSKIVENKVSKYNYAPMLELGLPDTGRRKVLIVDQKKGDMSIKYGCAGEETFWAMLDAAVDSGMDVYIKQHPCAISGSPDEAHFTRDSIGADKKYKDVHLIGFDINPYSLISEFDEVYVVTSGMGFEALMAGKKVTCFGGAFYSNWGVTDDRFVIGRRSARRTLEEIFHVFYQMLTVYIDPVSESRCSLERLVDYIVETRG